MATEIQNLLDAGDYTAQLSQLINDPLTTYGPAVYPFLGATLLPEVICPLNKFKEEGIKYRSTPANHGTAYSPTQIKGGIMTGEMDVELAFSDIAAQMTAKTYDSFVRLLRKIHNVAGSPNAGVSPPSMDAMAVMLQWGDRQLVQPLAIRNEIDRWKAIVTAQVPLLGNNGYNDLVKYPNISGHRVTAGGTYSDDTYDPIPDLTARVNFLASKGYRVVGMISSTPVKTILTNNAKVRQRAGILSIMSGTITGLQALLSLEALNNVFAQNDLPPLTLYDATYTTQTGFGYFLQRDAIVFVCATGRDETISRGDLEPVVHHDTLGYVGIGTVSGQSDPGKHVYIEHRNVKPISVFGEAYQASLPVITDPEAMAAITGIA